MRSTRGDVRDHIVLHKNDQTFVSGLESIAAVETSKHRLSRDFQRRSIFDFCNNICQQRTHAAQQTTYTGCNDLLYHLIGARE